MGPRVQTTWGDGIVSFVLSDFCGDADSFKYYLAHPFSDGDYTYATNGHILVRVTRLQHMDEAHEIMRGKCAKLFAEHAGGELVPMPVLPEPQLLACGECEHGCAYCVNGWYEKPQWIELGDSGYQLHYLRKIAALPNARIKTNGEVDPAYFTFDGGDGLLMPCRRY